MEEMNDVMIERWNQCVKEGDTVVHLGDFSLGSPDDTIKTINKLNGNIILVKGNHDRRTKTFWEKRAGFKKYFKKDITICENIILSHRPKKLNDISIPDIINLHGHVHNNLSRYHSEGCVNLSVDVWDFYPVHIDEIEVLSKKDKDVIRNFFAHLEL